VQEEEAAKTRRSSSALDLLDLQTPDWVTNGRIGETRRLDEPAGI